MKTKVANRDITTVINEVISVLPPIISKREQIIHSLNSIKDSANYTAPEAMSVRWKELMDSLNYYLGDLDTDWKKKINQIVTGDSEEEKKWYHKFRIKEEDRDKFQSLVYGDSMIDIRLIMPFLRELTNRYEREIHKKVEEIKVFKEAWNEVTKLILEGNKTQNNLGSTLNEYLSLCEKQNKMIIEKETTIRELRLKLVDKGVDVD